MHTIKHGLSFLCAAQLLFGLLFHSPAMCQEEGGVVDLDIPPLGKLIDAAMNHSPLLNQQEAMIRMREFQERSASIDWSRYIYLFSEIRYGSMSVLVVDGIPINYGNNSNSTWFNVGTRVQTNIFDILDHRRKYSIAHSQTEFEEARLEELKRLLREDVIRLWNKLVTYKEIVKVSEEHIAVQNTNIFYAEQQFKAGDIPLLEYSRIKEISIKAVNEYHLAMKEFRETYLLLESMIGIKFSQMSNKQ